MSQLTCPHCSAVLELSVDLVSVQRNSLPIRRSARGRFGLRESESRVVDQVVDGMTNKEIAEEMKISEQVVKNHLCFAYTKIGCTNRAEMVSMILLGTDQPR